MRKRETYAVLTVVFVLLAGGVIRKFLSRHSGAHRNAPVAVGDVRSQFARTAAPFVSPADAVQLAVDNRAFAADLHRALRARSGNLVYSPASVSVALAMLSGGARGNTAAEIARALHFTLPFERLHAAFAALDVALKHAPSNPAAFRLALTNAVWGQRGHPFLPAYLDLLGQNYDVGIRTVDFGKPEPARLQINQWVADNTGQNIKDLIPDGAIDAATRLVLTNAVYFKADWLQPFAPNSAGGVFHAPTGDVTVPMMRGCAPVSMWSGAGFHAASLPYAGASASMVIVVPDAGTLDTFERGLTGDGLGAILEGGHASVKGELSMPRFRFATTTHLVESLQALGMTDAFQENVADLSGIDGTQKLFVQAVLHKATIAVDEKGTEAAAATGVIFVLSAMMKVSQSLTVDRPFLFFIRDNATGAILFQGRVVDPTKQP